jgi:hypothetical protein
VIEARRAQLNFANHSLPRRSATCGRTGCGQRTRCWTMIQALAKRRPKSRGAPSRPGRLGTPAEVVLRLPLLKHIRSWSYEVVERALAAPSPG